MCVCLCVCVCVCVRACEHRLSVVYWVATRDRGSEGLADAIEHYQWLTSALSRRVRREVSRIEADLARGRDAIRDLAESRVALEDRAVSRALARTNPFAGRSSLDFLS